MSTNGNSFQDEGRAPGRKRARTAQFVALPRYLVGQLAAVALCRPTNGFAEEPRFAPPRGVPAVSNVWSKTPPS
jgi:hypothetical protein